MENFLNYFKYIVLGVGTWFTWYTAIAVLIVFMILDYCTGALEFKNRGVKTSIDLYELKNTKMPSVIVEVCFVEATEDVALYKKLGPDAIGKTIAEAINNKKINGIKVEWDMNKLVCYFGDADVFEAGIVAQKYGCPLMKLSNYKTSGLKAKEVIQIDGNPDDKTRYDTFKNAAKLV